MTNQKSINWLRYFLEFLSIFFGVTFAFVLSTWNEESRDIMSENKILLEVKNGLEQDLEDIVHNKYGHQTGIDACDYFKNYVLGNAIPHDSVHFYYYRLLRDFISIQNKSGYESLKSKGLEIITNDSLRTQIISLYDFDYEILEKLEESYGEIQFHNSYFHPINNILSPYFVFDENGELSHIKSNNSISALDKNKLLAYLMKIEGNRSFTHQQYKDVEANIRGLIEAIDKEIE